MQCIESKEQLKQQPTTLASTVINKFGLKKSFAMNTTCSSHAWVSGFFVTSLSHQMSKLIASVYSQLAEFMKCLQVTNLSPIFCCGFDRLIK